MPEQDRRTAIKQRREDDPSFIKSLLFSIEKRRAFLPLYILGILGLGLIPTYVYLFETDLARRRDEARSMQAQWSLEMMGKLNGSISTLRVERFVEGLRVRNTETGYLNVRNYAGVSFVNGIKVEIVDTLSPGTLIQRALLTEGGSPYFNPIDPNSPKGTWAIFPCEDIEKLNLNPKLQANRVCAVFAGYLESN